LGFAATLPPFDFGFKSKQNTNRQQVGQFRVKRVGQLVVKHPGQFALKQVGQFTVKWVGQYGVIFSPLSKIR